MVTFPEGEKTLEVSVPVKSSGITESVLMKLTAFARGYKMMDLNRLLRFLIIIAQQFLSKVTRTWW